MLNLAERNQLVTENLPLAKHVASRHWKTRHNASGLHALDDLIQECNLALIRAAEAFDPTRGVKFITLAYHYCHKQCLTHQRLRERDQRDGAGVREALYEAVIDPHSLASPLDRLAEEEQRRNRLELASSVLSELRATEREVLLGECDGHNQGVIAARRGVTRQCISQISRRVRSRLAGGAPIGRKLKGDFPPARAA